MPAVPALADPPIKLRLSAVPSLHHSIALPYTSNNPQSLGFNRPPGHMRPWEFDEIHAYSLISSSEFPKNLGVFAPARVANFHSATVGNRYPDRLAKSGYSRSSPFISR